MICVGCVVEFGESPGRCIGDSSGRSSSHLFHVLTVRPISGTNSALISHLLTLISHPIGVSIPRPASRFVMKPECFLIVLPKQL